MKHRGYTLTELLVVIAIIGILIALLLPAVQAAREVARKTQCQNNLKQIGLALIGFHDRVGRFPPAHWQNPNQVGNYGQPDPLSDDYYFSWLTRILPHIEQESLYQQIQFDEWPWPNPPQGTSDGRFINAEDVRVFHCPSFPYANEPSLIDFPPEVGLAFTHYLGVNGTHQFAYDGILHVNSKVTIGQVLDGTSNTLLVGERPPTHDRQYGWWFADSGQYPWFGAAGNVLGTEEVMMVNQACMPNGPQSHYQRGVFSYEDDGYGWDKHAWHFWSAHSGDGAFFLFADGRVKFIPYTVSPVIFRNLGTYKGGEANNGNF